MHVDMVKELLVPGMKYLYDTGDSTKIFFVCRQFQKRFGTTFVQETIKKFLVAVDQGIEFMGQGKDYVEVSGVNDFRPASVYPDFLKDSLTVRTVAVSAGIVVKISMSAVLAYAYVAAEFSGFTVKDGMGSFPLDIRLMISGRTEVLIRKIPYLLDLGIMHASVLPYGQKG